MNYTLPAESEMNGNAILALLKHLAFLRFQSGPNGTPAFYLLVSYYDPLCYN